MRQLLHDPGTAAMVPHLLLEEMGVPYQRIHVDRAAGEHRQPEYLRLNPNGLLPVLVEDDLVLYETAAIVLHLCDCHPHAGLAPALGTAERGHFYKWLAWLTNTLQATLLVYFYPERWVDEGHVEAAGEVRRHAQARVAALLELLDQELARHRGPWFLEGAYSALDAYVFTLCRWTRNFSERPARGYPHLGSYLQRMLERPAVQRVLANEGLQPPYV